MGKQNKIDENRVIELYKKFESINRTSLSAGCCPQKVKEILLKNNIEIKAYRAARWNYNWTRW